jgi:hypothetical protein
MTMHGTKHIKHKLVSLSDSDKLFLESFFTFNLTSVYLISTWCSACNVSFRGRNF